MTALAQRTFRTIALLFITIAFATVTPSTTAQRKYPTTFGQAAGQPQPQPPAQTQTAPEPTPATPAPATANGAAAENRKLSYDLQVSGAQQWSDTGIDVVAGDRVTLASDGTLDYVTTKATPEGLPRSWREVVSALPLNSAGIGTLIGRLGTAGVEVPFVVGSSKEITATRNGRLFLGVNQTASEMGQGSYQIKVQITPAATKQAIANVAPIKLPSDLFARIPRRIQDKEGNAGDMVNFIMIGPQEKMQQAFADAGWVQVDRTKADAALHALLSTYSKKAYTEMPMSELYLFNRPQDFGFARADPVQVVQTRHHLRVWKAPFDVEGEQVWIGAATHDIGFEHDNRSQSASAITHKIDPNIDVERDFVGDTLNGTGDLANLTKVTPSDPLREAKTATGGSFHSDGQLLVMQLAK